MPGTSYGALFVPGFGASFPHAPACRPQVRVLTVDRLLGQSRPVPR
ncbi:hypothetical protein SCAB_83311 [Streptomyces scabiei 87.22]|uniref:Uncharacterized protein n=1 Tax=Streptomyces scabiei (strain 87.22) TaxID=680198 RepID=C9YX28_STRSW|nr:hypothetical protein SCAB_83311 [Streptomyces scabiei 87.22]